MKKFTTLAAMGVLLVAAAAYMPTAIAHECQAEAGTVGETTCSTECTEGEDHHHVITHHHENGLGQDENHIHYDCTSRSGHPPEPERPCMTPRVLGICLISEGAAPNPSNYCLVDQSHLIQMNVEPFGGILRGIELCSPSS